MLELNGQSVWVQDSGGDGRPVVFIHGNSSSSRTWGAVLASPLLAQHRLITLDLPGHGRSAPAASAEVYSMPGYAGVVQSLVKELGLESVTLVGWSLGGHIALEASADLPGLAGLVIFGAPPVGSPAAMAEAFLPNPAMNVGFTAEVSPDDAAAYATSFVAAGSGLPLDAFVADILATDGAARAGLIGSIGTGRFADEVSIAAGLTVPIAVLHGSGEQLVSLEYLEGLALPTLWRGRIQVIEGAGHAPQEENPDVLSKMLSEFLAELAQR